MSNDWSNSLKHALTNLKPIPPRPLRMAVVGVGHELRGDDAAGVMVARKLQPAFSGNPHLLIVDGGHAPENVTGILRRVAPDGVLLVDAAEMGEPSGTIRWLEWGQLSGLSASTHTLPLDILSRYLTIELGCRVALIGIQPAQTTLGEGLSPRVQIAVDEVVQDLTLIFHSALMV